MLRFINLNVIKEIEGQNHKKKSQQNSPKIELIKEILWFLALIIHVNSH